MVTVRLLARTCGDDHLLSALGPLSTVRRPPIYPKTPGHLPCSSLTHPLPLSSRRPSVSFGGFGLKSMSLRGNQLSGEVPAELADLPNLKRVWLSDNQLTRCLPIGLPVGDEVDLPLC